MARVLAAGPTFATGPRSTCADRRSIHGKRGGPTDAVRHIDEFDLRIP